MTSGTACSLDDILDSGLLKKAADTFIACDRLIERTNTVGMIESNNNINNGASNFITSSTFNKDENYKRETMP